MTTARYFVMIAMTLFFASCKKMKDEMVISCSQKMIELTIVASPSLGCNSNSGAISVLATGSSNFTYSINSAPFQSSGNFTHLKNGTYSLTARDEAGCEQTKLTLVGSGVVAGPKFTALKNLFVMRCNRCHSGSSPAALKDWSIDCVVLDNKQVINTRAVVVADMPKGGPQLSAVEKDIIRDWLAAGGLIEN